MAAEPPPTAIGESPHALVILSDRPCVHCRYNLRGLSPDTVCPECGKPVRDSLGDLKLLALGGPTLDLLLSAMRRIGWAPAYDAILALTTAAALLASSLVSISRLPRASGMFDAFQSLALLRETAQVAVYAFGASGLVALSRCPREVGGPDAPWIARTIRAIAVGQVACSLCSLVVVLITSKHPANESRPGIAWLPRDLADTLWLFGLFIALQGSRKVRALLHRPPDHPAVKAILAVGYLLVLLAGCISISLLIGAFSPRPAAKEIGLAHAWLWLGGYAWGLAAAWLFARTIASIQRSRSDPAVLGPSHPNAAPAG